MAWIETVAMALAGAASGGMLIAGALGLEEERKLGLRLIGVARQGNSTAPRRPLPLHLFDHLMLGRQDQAEIERTLRAAGYFDPRALRIFLALRLCTALTSGLFAALALWLTGRWEGASRALPLLALWLGHIGAKLILGALVKSRIRRINAELPFALDLLVMMLESGSSLDQCFRTFAVEGAATPNIREAMQGLVEDSQHGMPYEQAFQRWTERLGVPGGTELAGLFRQSMFQGVELGGALREFGQEFNDRRVAAAREDIGRRTTKMALVMMVFMMPALFIVLCGPAVVTVLATLSGARS